MYMRDRFGTDGDNYKLPNLKGKPLASDYHYVICVEGKDPILEGAGAPLLGQPLLMPYDEARRDLLRCDDQLRSVRQNQSLYELIGNKFGGNKQQFAGCAFCHASGLQLLHLCQWHLSAPPLEVFNASKTHALEEFFVTRIGAERIPEWIHSKFYHPA